MSIINSDSIVANKIILSQQLNQSVEQWLQSGGRVQQLNNCGVLDEKLSFNDGYACRLCEVNGAIPEYSSVKERRELIFKCITAHPKYSTNALSAHLKIWQGTVSSDIKYLRKHGRINHERVGLVYYYTAVAAEGTNHD